MKIEQKLSLSLSLRTKKLKSYDVVPDHLKVHSKKDDEHTHKCTHTQRRRRMRKNRRNALKL